MLPLKDPLVYLQIVFISFSGVLLELTSSKRIRKCASEAGHPLEPLLLWLIVAMVVVFVPYIFRLSKISTTVVVWLFLMLFECSIPAWNLFRKRNKGLKHRSCVWHGYLSPELLPIRACGGYVSVVTGIFYFILLLSYYYWLQPLFNK